MLDYSSVKNKVKGMMKTGVRSVISAFVIALIIVGAATVYVQYSMRNKASPSSSTFSHSSTTGSTSGSQSVSSSSSTSSSTTPTTTTTTYSSITQQSGFSTLAIRITDPPVVPTGTRSLNLSFSSLSLLVSQTLNNSGTQIKNLFYNISGTINLLSVQNVSQTIAVTKIPNGTVLYSMSLTVKSVSININGTVYPVHIALNGSQLNVIFYPKAVVNGDTVALVQISPIVVKTATGYQMIPSVVATAVHEKIENEQVGEKHQLNQNETSGLDEASGQLTAQLKTISVSGNLTSFSVLVNNTGHIPVSLLAISVHTDFKVLTCSANGEGEDHGENKTHQASGCERPESVYFRVQNMTTSSSGCGTAKLVTLGEDSEEGNTKQVLNPGQCVLLNFSGVIVVGESNTVLVPSLAQGSTIEIQVLASNNGELLLSCTMPLSSTSCTVRNGDEGD